MFGLLGLVYVWFIRFGILPSRFNIIAAMNSR